MLLAVRALLLALLFVRRVTDGSVLHSRLYSEVESTTLGTNQTSSNVHNITVACEDHKTAFECRRDLNQLLKYGYPWSYAVSQRRSKHNPNATDKNITLGDALDSLNHVCYIHDKSQACLEENGITNFCLAATPVGLTAQTDFQFICMSSTAAL